jgi:hypothetical protein
VVSVRKKLPWIKRRIRGREKVGLQQIELVDWLI